jgi:hypothetical protein
MRVLKKWLLRGLLFTAFLLAVLAGFVAFQPDQYAVERAISIQSQPKPIFIQVENLKAWNNWNPWSKLDPNAKVLFSGPPSGKGSSIEWSGNSQVGEGAMTITECQPDSLVELEQVFVKPMAGKAKIKVMLAQDDLNPQFTRVTMRLEGSNNFMAKAVCMVMNMDEMIGGAFAKGLLNLKEKVEQGSGK